MHAHIYLMNTQHIYLIRKISNFLISERGRDLIIFVSIKKIEKISNLIRNQRAHYCNQRAQLSCDMNMQRHDITYSE